MPTSAAQAASQRERWERGRAQLGRARGLSLIGEGVRRRKIALCDAGWDLLQPPLAQLAALLTLWGALILVGFWTRALLPNVKLWTSVWTLTVAGFVLYVFGGLRVAGAPRAAFLALLRAPGYALWKFALLLKRRGRTDEWVRTGRAPMETPTE